MIESLRIVGLRTGAIGAVVVSVLASLWILFRSGGWLSCIFALGYIAILVFHIIANRRVLRLPDQFVLLRSACSSLLLVVAFLLQYDAGDGYAWLAYRALMFGAGQEKAQPPTWWPGGLANPVLFIPWFLLATALARNAKFKSSQPPQVAAT